MQYLPKDETLIERLDSVRRTLNNNEPLIGQVAPFIIEDFRQAQNLNGSFTDAFQRIAQMNADADAAAGSDPNYRAVAEHFFERFSSVVRPSGFMGSDYVELAKPFRGYGSMARQFRNGLLCAGALEMLVFGVVPAVAGSPAFMLELLRHFWWLMALGAFVLAAVLAFAGRSQKRDELKARKNAVQKLIEQLRFIDNNTPNPPELRAAA